MRHTHTQPDRTTHSPALCAFVVIETLATFISITKIHRRYKGKTQSLFKNRRKRRGRRKKAQSTRLVGRSTPCRLQYICTSESINTHSTQHNIYLYCCFGADSKSYRFPFFSLIFFPLPHSHSLTRLPLPTTSFQAIAFFFFFSVFGFLWLHAPCVLRSSDTSELFLFASVHNSIPILHIVL